MAEAADAAPVGEAPEALQARGDTDVFVSQGILVCIIYLDRLDREIVG
jgi:hypothetical protein